MLTWFDLFENNERLGAELYDTIITVSGSRSGITYQQVNTILDNTMSELKVEGIFVPNTLFIVGGANGVDKYAENYFKTHNIPYVVREADWDEHGKRAGVLRNIEMIDKSKRLLALWDGVSPGTKQAINYAESKSIPTLIYIFPKR